MKKNILLFSFAFLCFSLTSLAQTALAEDQNPNYLVSQNKYMKLADSITAWHSTTVQETYKAIDYIQDKREARTQREAFRRELRLERARNAYRYYGAYDDDFYYEHPSYHRPYNNYRYRDYNHYRPRSYYRTPQHHYRSRGHRGGFRITFPFVFPFGFRCR